MVSEKADIRKFVFRELHRCTDLSTLTLGILRRRYLEHVGRESLSVEHKQLLKKIVEEELLKMQVEDNGSDESLVMNAEPSRKQNKRKREDEQDEGERHNEDNVVARKKKSRFESVPPDSPDSGIEKAGHEEALKEDRGDEESDEQTEKVEKKAQRAVRGSRKGGLSSESREEEEEEEEKRRQSLAVVDSEEEELDSLDDSGEEEENRQEAKSRGQRRKKRASSDRAGNASGDRTGKARAQKSRREEKVNEPSSPESEAVRRVQKEVFGSSSESEGESERPKAKGKESDEEMSQKKDGTAVSSDEELEGKGKERDEDKDSESDSSSLPSLEEEEEEEELSKKPKREEKKKSGSKRKTSDESKVKEGKLDEENKAVSRLKRYIALCGVRRNYKKLLAGCRSVKAKVAVLKKELEDLGVEGQPSIEKCKKARLKREEAQELAELDVGNIITTQGRPRRRAATSWPHPGGSSSPPSAFKRVVNSESDSENDSTGRGRKRTTDWGNLKGIISDDADSD